MKEPPVRFLVVPRGLSRWSCLVFIDDDDDRFVIRAPLVVENFPFCFAGPGSVMERDVGSGAIAGCRIDSRCFPVVGAKKALLGSPVMKGGTSRCCVAERVPRRMMRIEIATNEGVFGGWKRGRVKVSDPGIRRRIANVGEVDICDLKTRSGIDIDTSEQNVVWTSGVGDSLRGRAKVLFD